MLPSYLYCTLPHVMTLYVLASHLHMLLAYSYVLLTIHVFFMHRLSLSSIYYFDIIVSKFTIKLFIYFFLSWQVIRAPIDRWLIANYAMHHTKVLTPLYMHMYMYVFCTIITFKLCMLLPIQYVCTYMYAVVLYTVTWPLNWSCKIHIKEIFFFEVCYLSRTNSESTAPDWCVYMWGIVNHVYRLRHL